MHKPFDKLFRVLFLSVVMAILGTPSWVRAQSFDSQVPYHLVGQAVPPYDFDPLTPQWNFKGTLLQQVTSIQVHPGGGIGLAKQTVGSGISDLALGGTLSSIAAHNLEITICAAGSPDTFDFALDAVPSCAIPTNITGAAQATLNGVTVQFGTTRGHTAGNVWVAPIGAQAAHEQGWYDANGTETCWVDDTGKINCVGGIGSNITLQTNTVNNLSQTLLNLVNGTGISIVNTSGGNVQISTSGALSICTTAQLDVQNDIHVSTTGNDSTGTGTVANPYLTVTRAIQDVPFLVCGRWVIHLDTTGTYTGQVNLAGRVFGGGGANYNTGDIHWPWSVTGAGGTTDNTWPYSWVEIVGSTAASESYILQESTGAGVDSGLAVISLSHANLTLRGLTVHKGGFGVTVENRSYLNLAGVLFTDNLTSVSVGHGSRLHFDASGFVDNDGVTMTSIRNDASLGGLWQFGFDVHDNSFVDDSDQRNSGNGSGGTGCNNCIVDYTSTGGTTSAAYRFMSGSGGHLYANLNCTLPASGTSCLIVTDANVSLEQGTFTGTNQTSVKAIQLTDAQVGSQNGGFAINLTNWDQGVLVSAGSVFNGLPSVTFTNVTTHWLGDATAAVLRSRDAFISVAIQPQDLSESGSFTPNLSFGSFLRVTLTGNSTMVTPLRPIDAHQAKLLICQDGVGGHTFTFPAGFAGAGTVGAAASKCSEQTFTYRASNATWYADGPMVTGM